MLAAIGPFWDGNEVWLLAAGGALFVAFPRVLASGLSGFYLAIFLVLWVPDPARHLDRVPQPRRPSAVARVLGRRLRAAPARLLPVLFGAALGNLVRGVPLDAEGWFSLPLFTDFTASVPVGILDWYTVCAGVFALIVLGGHGATFLLWKSEGPVHARSRRAAGRLYAGVAVLWPLLTVATWRRERADAGGAPGPAPRVAGGPAGRRRPARRPPRPASRTGPSRRFSDPAPSWRACWPPPRPASSP